MPLVPLTIFILTYIGIALGEVPGLKLDRTGMALLGALAMVVAGVLLCSRRMSTRAILGFVDWHLITLFCGLFIVIRGLQVTGVPDALVSSAAERGIELADYRVLTVLSVALMT